MDEWAIEGQMDGCLHVWINVLILRCVCFFPYRKETCGRQLTALYVPALKASSSVGPNSVYQSPPAPR